MSNDPSGKPKTVMFRLKTPVGASSSEPSSPPAAVQAPPATPQPPVAVQVEPIPPPVAGTSQPPASTVVTTPAVSPSVQVGDQPEKPVAEAPVAEPTMVLPAAAPASPSAGEPTQPAAQAAGGEAGKHASDRPHSRKFTLKKSPTSSPAEKAGVTGKSPAAVTPQAAVGQQSVPATQPSGAHEVQNPAPSTVPSIKKSYVKMIVSLSAWGIAFCALTFVVFWLTVRGQTAGQFGGVVGRVEIQTKNFVRMAGHLSRVISGDTIHSTSQLSSGSVYFNAVDYMQIYGESAATIRVTKKTETKPEGRVVEVVNGTVDFDVTAPYPGRIISVATSNAIVSFNIGKFLMTYSNNVTRLAVREGTVTIGQRGGEKKAIEVQAGFEVAVAEGIPFARKSISGDTMVKELFLILAVEGIDVDGVDSPLKSEIQLDRNKITGLLGVRATTEPEEVGSVKFEMQGCAPVVVNSPGPYVFKGKPNPAQGDGWKPERGQYTLNVTVYSKKDGKGKPSVPKSVLFKIKGAADY
ncbi:MAG: hypothetical protein WCL44_06320 [bacterium]